MIIICSIEEDDNTFVHLHLVDRNKKVFSSKCKQNNFCEQLPLMMEKVITLMKKKYSDNWLNKVKVKIDFDVKKHATTYRIFESFIEGITVNQ